MNYQTLLRIAGSFVYLVVATTLAAETSVPSLIPLPQKVERHEGLFSLRTPRRFIGLPLRSGTKIVVDAAAQETGHYLAAQLWRATGCRFKVETVVAGVATKGNILLTTRDAKSGLGMEGYELAVTTDSVVIRAPQAAGLFYGVQSLLQLLPPEVFAAKLVPAVKWTVPCINIEDQPRFVWRGLMLDVSRHFSSKAEVKQILEAMALHKLNTFHWHLTDDQGWRIEIKKYPLLTRVGAWRKQIGFNLDPKASTAYGPDGRYGGYYTQADIKEIVAYAQTRHITIVPEIEMPGHASAALMAYPEFSCTGGPFTTDLPGGVFNGVYCAGNEQAFSFVQDILAEVCELFPSKYIHIGGDEVPPDNWTNCAKCQIRFQQEGLKTAPELEGYFIRRIEKCINAHGRSLIGWSEIREGGLAQNAAIMDWIGGAIEAATAGHNVVMTPLADCYFDHYQSTNTVTEPHAIGGYLPLDQVYNFNPMPAKLESQYQSHILGAQANVWTEYMPSLSHVEYMVFPRLCALAEVTWSPQKARNWADFNQRMQLNYRRLDQFNINYRRNTSNPGSAHQPISDGQAPKTP
ncbi:MAG: hexosaminidase [Pedosphaera sp.]|nr:hexosaminidase [Pedosphaera sp.]